jgi:hypothetical protein
MTDHEFKVGDLVKINHQGSTVNGGIWLEGTPAKIVRLPESPSSDPKNDWYMLERDDDQDQNLYAPSEFDLVAYPVSDNTTIIVGELAEAVTPDMVNHPPHYTQYGCEVIEITEHLTFNAGNAVKYIARAPLKGNQIQDLEKAAWYLAREIDRLKRGGA